MSIIRVQKNENYTCINNTGINDKNLSWGAKGLLVYLLSKPNNWSIFLEQLKKVSRDKRDSTRSKLKELEEAGYIKKGKQIRENGKFKGYEYDIYESPCRKNRDGSPVTENPTVVSTEGVSTEVNLLSKDNITDLEKSVNKKSKNNYTLRFEDSNKLTKKFMNKHFDLVKILHPKINEKKYFDEKEIYKCELLINCFIKGFPKSNYSKLRDWCNKNIKSDLSFLEKGFGEERFINLLNQSIKVYQYDYQPENKQYLPNRLSDFLHNHFKDRVSSFLYYVFNKPKTCEKEKVDKYPKITTKYHEEFLGDIELSIKQKNKLIKFVKNLHIEHDIITNSKVKINDKNYKRVDFESDKFVVHISSIKNFITEHIMFLNSNKKLKEKGVNALSTDNYIWDMFESHYEKTHNIVFYPDQDYLTRKCKTFLKNFSCNFVS